MPDQPSLAARDDIAVCPDCGIECPPEWGLFDYFDHLAEHDARVS